MNPESDVGEPTQAAKDVGEPTEAAPASGSAIGAPTPATVPEPISKIGLPVSLDEALEDCSCEEFDEEPKIPY